MACYFFPLPILITFPDLNGLDLSNVRPVLHFFFLFSSAS